MNNKNIIVFTSILLLGVLFYFTSYTKDPIKENVDSNNHSRHASLSVENSSEVEKKSNLKTITQDISNNEKAKPQAYKWFDKSYDIKIDCYFDVATDIYQNLMNDTEGYDWLSERGYTLTYEGSTSKIYQNFSVRELINLATINNDQLAMLRLGFKNSISGNTKEAIKWYEMMLVESNFVAIDQVISLYNMKIVESDDNLLIGFQQEKAKWLALKNKVNGLNLFTYQGLESETSSLIWGSWATDKLKEINQIRKDKGYKEINIQALTGLSPEESLHLKEFQKQQGALDYSPCPDW